MKNKEKVLKKRKKFKDIVSKLPDYLILFIISLLAGVITMGMFFADFLVFKVGLLFSIFFGSVTGFLIGLSLLLNVYDIKRG